MEKDRYEVIVSDSSAANSKALMGHLRLSRLLGGLDCRRV
jgi:hypothetical protein